MFSTFNSRERYTQTVLYDFRLTDDVIELADQLSNRMIEKAGGRMWMGAHMRRGDCQSPYVLEYLDAHNM